MWNTGIPVTRLKCDGGVSKNRFIRQFLADILGIPIEYTGHPEPTALGAAFLAGLSSGYYRSKKELGSCLHIARKNAPKIDDNERKKKYKTWKDAITRSLRYAKKD